MALRKHLVALLVTFAWLAFGGSAMAAFPNFTGCPTSNPAVTNCVDIQSLSGSLEIKGFTVPLGDSMEIRGGLTTAEEGPEGYVEFIPATGTNGLFTKPIQIPGGLLGIEFPIPGNAVTGTAQLAGSASDIRMRFGVPTAITIPVKLKLDNPILGSGCYIGSNGTPVRLNLTTATTSPPLPNRPISGRLGSVSFEGDKLFIRGTVSVDNSFSITTASGCGLLGIFNPLVNLKLGLPSAAGNNTMIVTNDVAFRTI